MDETLHTGSRLLDALPASEAAIVAPRLRAVTFLNGEIMYRPGESYRDVYFPVTSVLSLVAVMSAGTLVEVGTIGRDGLSAPEIVLGAERTFYQLIWQIPGNAFGMTREHFDACLGECRTLRAFTLRSVRALSILMAQSIACNQLHPLAKRCARWLLSAHDRLDGNEFTLTQEFLAMMLGVHRPGVSIAAASLQRRGLIALSPRPHDDPRPPGPRTRVV